jgi:hypothetical protein
MESNPVATLIKMVETLPEPAQEKVVEHLRRYIDELQDEARWDELFKKTQPKLIEVARRARKEASQGNAQPLDLDRL